VLIVANIGSNNLVLKDESASSTDVNRFGLSGDITLEGGDAVTLQYDTTSNRWRAIGSSPGYTDADAIAAVEGEGTLELSGIVGFANYQELAEISAPGAGAANKLRLYALDGPSTAVGGHTSVPSFVDSAGTTTIIDSGVYTPTLTGVTNVGSFLAFDAQWMRIGEVVTVSGKFNCDPTTADIVTKLGISLPVASNFTTEEDCGGATGCRTFEGSGLVFGSAASDRATAEFFPTSAANAAWGFTFPYRIL